VKTYIYCDECRKAWLLTNESQDFSYQLHEQLHNHGQHTDIVNHAIDFPGVDLVKEFVTNEEEESLCYDIESKEWTDSQSGRRKQV